MRRHRPKYFLKHYDIELAVRARRMIAIEAHSKEEIDRMVWNPTIKLLKDLAKTKPNFLLCSHGQIFEDEDLQKQTGCGGNCADLYLIGRQKRVVYLGTVMDKEQSRANWEFLIKSSVRTPDFDTFLKGPMVIIRHRIRWYIPGNSVVLGGKAFNRGVKKFMRTYVSVLSSVPIRWLPSREQEALDVLIRCRADKEAKPQTKEEKLKAWIEDSMF